MRFWVAPFAVFLSAAPVYAGAIEDIHARGVVQCGMRDGSPPISSLTADNMWRGLAVDFCAALAAAVTGKATSIDFVPVTAEDQVAVLQSGEVDVLLAPYAAGFADEATDGTLAVAPLLHAQGDRPAIAPIVRQGDDGWFMTVRWVLYALITAEELGVTQAMAAAGEVPPSWREGEDAEAGKAMGLQPKWRMASVAAAGNYAEIFARHIGTETKRGPNALVKDGGLLFAPPFGAQR